VTTVLDALRKAEQWLRARGVPSPRTDAERILAHALSVERLDLYLQFARPLEPAELEVMREALRRRGQREPLAWVLGTVGFHTIDLTVSPGVLVPRPDTETLVDAALSWIATDEDPCYVADPCTGSGAVGLAIAAVRPGARCYLTDQSDAALENARKNVAALDLTARVAVLRGDLLQPIPTNRTIDLVVCNPPYIPSADINTLEPEVSRWEPRLALDGGPDGLALVRRLVTAAAARARRGLLLEVGHDQADAVAAMLTAAGFVGVTTWKDLGGHTRVVGGRVAHPA
jgi:release factor glutamine methyltransferase